MGSVGSAPPTGPAFKPRTAWDALRKRVESIERNIGYLQKNRTPAPVGLEELSNASGMTQVPSGHVPTFSGQAGSYQPAPNYAEFIFHLQGSLTSTESPPYHSRWASQIVGVSADLGTFTDDVTWEVLVNGTPVITITQTAQSTGQIAAGPVQIAAYTDLVTIQVTDTGSGNSDLVVHVEYGSVVSGAVQLAE